MVDMADHWIASADDITVEEFTFELLVRNFIRVILPSVWRNHSPAEYYSVYRKAVKRTLFHRVLAIDKSINRNISGKAGFASYFSKLFADFRKMDLSYKLHVFLRNWLIRN